MTDENCYKTEITKEEVKEAILNKNIVISDYSGSREFALGVLRNNPDKCDFVMAGKSYKNNINLIDVDVGEFKDNISLCVSFRKENPEIASTTYLSAFPSAFFLNRKKTN